MALLTKAPRGTQDILPGESYKWQYVEKTALSVAASYGFKEVRVPTFEHTELFLRSVGETTDVVQKEMYTFTDKGGRSITLRPELTAGVLRAGVEHGVFNDTLPAKLCYAQSAFRYEKPQAGRFRELHQFGIELVGPASPSSDVEVISLAADVLKKLGITARLEINSIGCPTCRQRYQDALKAHFSKRKDELCESCQDRLQRNPLRLLDCKSPVCQEIGQGAPMMLDFLCEECATHFDGVKAQLTALGFVYNINPKIVRGLDYYTKTVFEFISDQIGSQSTVCGGGRYEGLINQIGGPDLPGVGFGMGLERILMVMEAAGALFPAQKECTVYIGSAGAAAAAKTAVLTKSLRDEGFWAEQDVMERSVKAQMKYANKIGARFSLIVGESEIETGKASLKNMADGSAVEIDIDAGPGEPGSLVKAVYDQMVLNLADSVETNGPTY